MLEGLLKKFKGELADVEEAESNQAHEFNLVEMHLSDTIAKDTSDRSEKAVTKGKREAASAKRKGELAEAKADKVEDEKLKQEIETTFRAKAETFKQNQKVREDELEAIKKATEIISSPEVSGSYAKHINLAQQPASLIQLGRSGRRVAAKRQAAEMLSQRA